MGQQRGKGGGQSPCSLIPASTSRQAVQRYHSLWVCSLPDFPPNINNNRQVIFQYRLWVRQRAEPVVVLLSCRIPKAQVHRLSIHHHIGRVVVEPDGSNVKNEPDSPRTPTTASKQINQGKMPLQSFTAKMPSSRQSVSQKQGRQTSSGRQILTRWGCTLQERHWWCS